MENTQLLNFDFNQINKNLPKNIYGLRIFDVDKNKTYDLVINHLGFCPNIFSERDQSRFNDYLSTLEYQVINDFYKYNKLKKPNSYYSKIEIMTDSNGDLFHLSKSID